nr:reverse transcriptase domain-containing protein [Tanacetum cinerariifolium]
KLTIPLEKSLQQKEGTTKNSSDVNLSTSMNAYAQPIGIEQANRITWTELKRLLTNKYCPQTKIKKMEDEFYNLSVKGNNLKTYVRRFQELAVLCPNMVPNNEKLMEVFIGGLPISIDGNVTASKPQTLEEAINIAQITSATITRIISVNNKMEGQKLSDPMLLLQLRTVDTLKPSIVSEMYPTSYRTLHNQVSSLQQGRSSDQELQKQRTSYWK